MEEDSLLINTNGPLNFDGSFIGFDTPHFIDINGNLSGFVDTTGSSSFVGETLEIDALHFLLNSGGDQIINTDSSISGVSARVGISSDTLAEVAVAEGALELLAEDQLQFNGLHVDIQGDNRISLYSYNSFSMESTNDFQAYASFIDFDSYGSIRLTSQTGNIHMDSPRDIIFEAEEISFSAPVGIDFQSEHGEIYIDASDLFSVTSDDIILVETLDEARFASDDDFKLSGTDLSITTADLIKFHSKTLESVFTDVSMQSYEMEIITGGDIDFLLNSRQVNTEYNFVSSNSISLESRNIIGSAASIRFDTFESGDVILSATSVFDSSITQDVDGDFIIIAQEDAIFNSPVIRLEGFAIRVISQEDIEFRADSSITDLIEINSGNLITIEADDISNSVAENGFFRGVDSISFTSNGDFMLTSGELIDEDLTFGVQNGNLFFLSDGASRIGSTRDTNVFTDTLRITSNDDFLGNSLRDITINVDQNMALTATTDIDWNAYSSYFEADFFSASVDTSVLIESAETTFWANENGLFIANDVMGWDTVNTGEEFNSLAFEAFLDINIDDIRSIIATTLTIEAEQSVSFTEFNDDITITSGDDLFFEAGGFNGIVYNGNFVNVNADNGISFDGGFIIFETGLNGITINDADTLSIDTDYEEEIEFFAPNLSWSMANGSNFALSTDDIIFNQALSTTLSSDEDIAATIVQGYEVSTFNDFVINAMNADISTMIGDIKFISVHDMTVSQLNSNYTFSRSYTIDVEGDLNQSIENDISFNAMNSFTIHQQAGPASIDNVRFNGDSQMITLTNNFRQLGGSSNWLINGDVTMMASDSILIDSLTKSVFDINGLYNVDTRSSAGMGYMWWDAEDILSSAGTGITTISTNLHISSSNAESITSRAFDDVLITSGSLSWNSVEAWNVTALEGLTATSNGMIDNIGIYFGANHDIMSEMKLFTRNGEIDLISLNSQTYSADHVSIHSEQDFIYTNYFLPASVGGVQFISSGSTHDGIYEDETGISIRSFGDSADIYFGVNMGSASINANEDITNYVNDGRSLYDAKTDITFLAQVGDINILNEQGDTILQSNIASVTFTTNENTELQSSDKISVLAGKAVSFISTDAIISEDNKLSFEFEALEGNILTMAVVNQPIYFEGNNFDLSSNEEMYLISSDDMPYITNNGGINVLSNTGIYLTVDGGDLDFNASDEIFITSAENYDIRIESGDDMTFIAQNGEIDFESIIDTQIRAKTGNILFQTKDSNGDITIDSEGEIRFQSDGTDDNIGASQVDGIFIEAPQIQAFASDDIIMDAGTLFTVGENTRPIISFEAGGSSTSPGVRFNSEGNINQVIGANFLISSNGAMLWESEDLDVTTGGQIRITTTGSNLIGNDIIFESDQKTTVSSNDIEMTAGDILLFFTEGDMDINSDTLLDVDIAGILTTTVREIYDINADDWFWTTETFNLETRGEVIFSNGVNGGISIYGDDLIEFTSDIVIDFLTFGANSPMTFSTIGSTSLLSITTEDDTSNILFEVSGTITATSEDQSTFNTLGAIQITSPLNSLYSDVNSNISIISAADLNFEAEGSLVFRGDEGITFTSDSDISISSLDETYIQVWQYGLFESLSESIFFNADYNITFITENGQMGDISIKSTRDIDVEVSDNAYEYIMGDYFLNAMSYFEMTSTFGDISFLTYENNGDIDFESAGDILIEVETDDYDIQGGNVYFTALGATSVTVDDDVTFETFGSHNDVNISANLGKLIFTSSGDIEVLSPGSTDFPSQRSGNGFVEFIANGVHPTDAYSFNIDVTTELQIDQVRGHTRFLSETTLDVAATTDIDFSVTSQLDTSFEITATSPGGSGYIEGTTEFNMDSDREIYVKANDRITFLPFDLLSVDGNGATEYSQQADVLIQTVHEGSDINIFTTDFLTGDISFRSTDYINIYSQEDCTFLLLDDDDTAVVGTYLIDAGQSITMGAENDFEIIEFGPGDIRIEDTGGIFFFTAGNDISVNVRHVLEFDIANLDVFAERDITFNAVDLDITSNSVGFRAERLFRITGDNHLFHSDTNILIQTADNGADSFSRDVRQEVMAFSESGTDFVSTTSFITLPPHRIVDFRDGLAIPEVGYGNYYTGTPIGCATDRSIFYEDTNNRICFCDAGSVFCMGTSAFNSLAYP